MSDEPNPTPGKTHSFNTRLRHVQLRGGPLDRVTADLHVEVELARVWVVHSIGAYVDHGAHWDWEADHAS